MIEIKVSGTITNALLMTLEEDQAERLLENQIAEGMTKQIMTNLEDMAYVDMKQNSELDAIDWEANMIICSKDQITSSVSIMAQRLVERLGATAEDIEYILEPAVTDLKEF